MKKLILILWLIPFVLSAQTKLTYKTSEVQTLLDKSKNSQTGVFNVLDYGAVGDGVTNNDAAIALALSAVNATKGVLYFPRGSYYLTNTIVINQQGVKIKGEGKHITKLLFHGNGTKDAIYVASVDGTEISDFTISCDSCLNAIELRSVYRSSITNISIGNINLIGSNFFNKGISIKGSIVLDIKNVDIFGNSSDPTKTAYGIVLDTVTNVSNYSTTTIITNAHINYTGTSAVLFSTNSSDNTIIGGAFEGNAGWGVKMLYLSRNNSIYDTDFEANTLGDVLISSDWNSLINIRATTKIHITKNSSYNSIIGGISNSLVIGFLPVETSVINHTYEALTDSTYYGVMLLNSRLLGTNPENIKQSIRLLKGNVYSNFIVVSGDTTVTKEYGRIVFKTSDSTYYGCRFIRPTGKKCWFPLN